MLADRGGGEGTGAPVVVQQGATAVEGRALQHGDLACYGMGSGQGVASASDRQRAKRSGSEMQMQDASGPSGEDAMLYHA